MPYFKSAAHRKHKGRVSSAEFLRRGNLRWWQTILEKYLLKVIIAHILVIRVPMQTLQTPRRCFLTRIKVFSRPFAVVHQRHPLDLPPRASTTRLRTSRTSDWSWGPMGFLPGDQWMPYSDIGVLDGWWMETELLAGSREAGRQACWDCIRLDFLQGAGRYPDITLACIHKLYSEASTRNFSLLVLRIYSYFPSCQFDFVDPLFKKYCLMLWNSWNWDYISRKSGIVNPRLFGNFYITTPMADTPHLSDIHYLHNCWLIVQYVEQTLSSWSILDMGETVTSTSADAKLQLYMSMYSVPRYDEGSVMQQSKLKEL